jgi:hypothetical protein
MPIASGDILFKFSTTAGSSGNSVAGSGAGSLGKYISTTQITDNTLHNLFDVITGDENAASTVDYRCIFIHNNNPSGLTMQSTVAWLQSEVAGGASIAIAADNSGASGINTVQLQCSQIANETTAPTAIGSWNSGVVKASGISLGDIGPGSGKAMWLRRTAANTAAVNNDGVTLRVECDSAA